MFICLIRDSGDNTLIIDFFYKLYIVLCHKVISFVLHIHVLYSFEVISVHGQKCLQMFQLLPWSSIKIQKSERNVLQLHFLIGGLVGIEFGLISPSREPLLVTMGLHYVNPCRGSQVQTASVAVAQHQTTSEKVLKIHPWVLKSTPGF